MPEDVTTNNPLGDEDDNFDDDKGKGGGGGGGSNTPVRRGEVHAATVRSSAASLRAHRESYSRREETPQDRGLLAGQLTRAHRACRSSSARAPLWCCSSWSWS